MKYSDILGLEARPSRYFVSQTLLRAMEFRVYEITPFSFCDILSTLIANFV